jgi:hypothetical protein
LPTRRHAASEVAGTCKKADHAAAKLEFSALLPNSTLSQESPQRTKRQRQAKSPTNAYMGL